MDKNDCRRKTAPSKTQHTKPNPCQRQSHNPRFHKRLATHLTVNDALGKIKFADHTEGDGATAGLGIIELALKKNRIDSLFLGKDLGSAGTGRSSPDDGNLVLHVQGRLGDWNGGEVLSDKGRSREC